MPGMSGEPGSWVDDGSADHRFRVVPAAYVFLRRAAQADPSSDLPNELLNELSNDLSNGPGEVLLQLRRGTGFMDEHWAAGAAGHVEAGESVVGAAIREAREELGVTLDAADLRPLTVMHRGVPHGPALEQRVDFFFEARRWSGTPHTEEAGKSAGLRWYPLDALPEPVVPHELRVLQALARGDLPRVMIDGL